MEVRGGQLLHSLDGTKPHPFVTLGIYVCSVNTHPLLFAGATPSGDPTSAEKGSQRVVLSTARQRETCTQRGQGSSSSTWRPSLGGAPPARRVAEHPPASEPREAMRMRA